MKKNIFNHLEEYDEELILEQLEKFPNNLFKLVNELEVSVVDTNMDMFFIWFATIKKQ